jgi:hypothetical protein
LAFGFWKNSRMLLNFKVHSAFFHSLYILRKNNKGKITKENSGMLLNIQVHSAFFGFPRPKLNIYKRIYSKGNFLKFYIAFWILEK